MYDSKGKPILGGYPVLVTTIGRIFFDPGGVMILFPDGSIKFADADFCRQHVEMIFEDGVLTGSPIPSP
jgi:ABC-type antimicrobial peptide transport system ATPase subunit